MFDKGVQEIEEAVQENANDLQHFFEYIWTSSQTGTGRHTGQKELNEQSWLTGGLTGRIV